MEEPMMRVLVLSLTLATLVISALGAGAIDTATLTCKELESSNHKDMVAMDAAIYEALKGDPELGTFSPAELSNAEDRACAKHPEAKVIDALRADN
jgi:hypothetical protein